MSTVIENYVPRHLRLGVCCGVPELQCYQDVVTEIPIVDDNGSVIRSDVLLKSLPVEDVMSKYRLKHFSLSAMLDAGVPLKVVNINHSTAFELSELQNICNGVNSAEQIVQSFEARQREKASWFKSFDEDNKSESVDFNEVY